MASGVASSAQRIAEAGMRGVSGAADAWRAASSRVGEPSRGRTVDDARGKRMAEGGVGDRASMICRPCPRRTGRAATLQRSVPLATRRYAAVARRLCQRAIRADRSARAAATGDRRDRPCDRRRSGQRDRDNVLENNLAGALSDELKEAVKGRAEHVAETAQRAAGDIGSDFRAAASEAADKLRKTGDKAVQTVKETVDAGREF